MWQEPKIDWIADDTFNYSDYTRIIENIKEVDDIARKLYTGIPILADMRSINSYEAIPYAIDWNNINDNVYTLNNGIFKNKMPEKIEYVPNGYSPNWEEFNKWETFVRNTYKPLKVLYLDLPHLEVTLGGEHELGLRVQYNREEILAHQLNFTLGNDNGGFNI